MEFSLEKWKLDYAESVADEANNIKIYNNLRNAMPHPYTKDDAVAYISDCIAKGDDKRICRAIVVDGRVVGSIGVFQFDDVYCKRAEIGYWLGENFWNNGIMTSAIQQIVSIAFEKLDVVRIEAEVFAYNLGSQKVLKNNGFIVDGIMRQGVFKNGKVYDSVMLSLTKSDFEATL